MNNLHCPCQGGFPSPAPFLPPKKDCQGCCAGRNQINVNPGDSYPSGGIIKESMFKLNNANPYIVDSSYVSYGGSLSVSENVITNLTQRRDTSCINLAGSFALVDSPVTNTALKQFLIGITKSKSIELGGLLPIIKGPVKFTVYYTVTDDNGGVVTSNSAFITCNTSNIHATDVQDYFVHSFKNIIITNITNITYDGLYILTIDKIVASVDVINTADHVIDPSTNQFYQFTDNNQKIQLHNDVIRNQLPDTTIVLAECNVNKSFTFQSNVTTRLRISFTAYLDAYSMFDNVFEVWNAMNDTLEERVSVLEEQVSALETRVSELEEYTYTKDQIDALLAQKVDAISGKGLSTNDYTDADKNKVAITNVLWFDNVSDLPETGVADTLYIVKETPNAYIWDAGDYKPFTQTT